MGDWSLPLSGRWQACHDFTTDGGGGRNKRVWVKQALKKLKNLKKKGVFRRGHMRLVMRRPVMFANLRAICGMLCSVCISSYEVLLFYCSVFAGIL